MENWISLRNVPMKGNKRDLRVIKESYKGINLKLASCNSIRGWGIILNSQWVIILCSKALSAIIINRLINDIIF